MVNRIGVIPHIAQCWEVFYDSVSNNKGKE